MARVKKEGNVFGRVLVDCPIINAKCGDYVTLPANIAAELEDAGEFDSNVPKQDETGT